MTPDHFGNFEAEVKLPALDTILFKFVVNGEWVTSGSYKTTHDEFGNTNNYLDAAELTAVEEFLEEPKQDAETANYHPEPSGAADESVEDKLTQVLTAESSYAAVSIPPSSDSAFEHVSDVSHGDTEATESTSPPGTDPDKPSCRNAPEDITPTNSAVRRPLDAEVTTLGGQSCDSSISGRPFQPDSETVALSPALARGKPRRREGLIIRLKSIFRG